MAVLSLLEAQLEAPFSYGCVNCCCTLFKFFYGNKMVTSEPKLEGQEEQNIACMERDMDRVVVGGGWNLVLHTHTHMHTHT